MAETLRANGGGVPNAKPLGEEEFLTLLQELETAESAHMAAVELCKAPKKKLKEVKEKIGARMPMAAFDRMREDVYKPGSQRQQEDAAYRQAMAWMGKPVLFQEEFSFSPKTAGEAEMHRIDGEGYEAGKAGHSSDDNPWTPGEERFARWQSAWSRGFTEFVEEQKRLAAEMGPKAGDPPRRGRPPGSRNKPKDGETPADTRH